MNIQQNNPQLGRNKQSNVNHKLRTFQNYDDCRDSGSSEQKQTRRLSSNEIKSIIPPFNPFSPLGLNSVEWIELLEYKRVLHEWNDEITLLYASIRLEDEAKIWFRHNFCKWQEFKFRLIDEFPPSSPNQSSNGLQRRKTKIETYEEYVSDCVQLAEDVNLNMKTTINYIIDGLDDEDMKIKLIELDIKSITELLSEINNINEEKMSKNNKLIKSEYFIQDCMEIQNKNSRKPSPCNEPPKKQTKQSAAIATNSLTKQCQKCKKFGHLTQYCMEKDFQNENSRKLFPCREPPKNETKPYAAIATNSPTKQCQKCKKSGHLTQFCTEQESQNRNLEIVIPKYGPPKKIIPSTACTDFVQTVKLENVLLSAEINMASDCTTLKRSQLIKQKWKMKSCNIQLEGFGEGLYKVLGRTCRNVSAGEVEMLIEILIVDDEVQKFPMILGRNFLENPNVAVVCNCGRLEIKFVETETQNTKKKRKRKRRRKSSSPNDVKMDEKTRR